MKIGPLIAAPVTAHPEETLAEVSLRIWERRVGSAVVVKEGSAYGIFTERDLLRAVAAGADPKQAKVADHMTPNAVTVTESWEVVDAARAMIDNRFRHLVVIDAEGRLTGILSLRDMVRALVEERKRIAAG